MNNTRIAKIIFTFLFIAAIILPLFFVDQLPDRVASHFDLNNQADGWMSKRGYMFFHYGIVIFFYLTFWGLSILIPKFPASLINLPQKDYWLHESRKENTFIILQAMILWIGNLCLALFVYVFYEILKANTSGTEKISGFSWVSIIIFLFGTMIVIIKYINRFTKKESQLEEQ